MATLPIFIAHIEANRCHLGSHAKAVKGYPEQPKTVGEHLRKRRLDLGQAQEQAAKWFAVSVTSYVHWEADRVIPDISRCPEIRKYLGYDPYPAPNCFSEAVQAIRRHLGIDRQRFAERLGVDAKSVLNWETSRRVPFPKTRERLAALSPDLSHLLQWA